MVLKMIAALREPILETGLQARIAGLATRQAQVVRLPAADGPRRETAILPVREVKLKESIDDRLSASYRELINCLSADMTPEQRAVLSRHELAKIVDSAVDAHLARHGINPDQKTRRDLVTNLMQTLLAAQGDKRASSSLRNHRKAVEAAKAKIEPLVLKHMDVGAAAAMPRPAFEAQLNGWVKELLEEAKIQLNFIEQRALVDSLVDDMLGLGPLEPLLEDETVSDIMVNGPKQVYVERRGKLELTEVTFRDEQHLMNICTKIATRIGRRIDELSPMVDARLPDGSRVHIIVAPLAIDGAMISIRKFSKKTITLDVMVANGSMSPAMATVLKIAARCR